MGTDLRHTPVVGGEIGYPDMVAKPDVSTLVRLPWEPDIAHCLSDLERAPEGVPEPTDPRGAVRRAVAAFEELGYSPVIGPELEFFLCERDEAAPGGWRRYVDNLSMVYTVGRQADPRGISGQMLRHLADLGIGAYAANHEYMNSQYEINLRESEALDAADRAFRLRAAVKDYAAQQGLLATFMGRPFNDQGGSGFHLHLSLNRDGENACAEGDELAPVTRWFVAGVLAHAPALMAVLNPTINAYRRILPDSLAPTHANWGYDNRSTFIRIPPERGEGARVEIRVGDGTANPYLAIAATLSAGLDGIRSELEPPAPIAGDAYTAAEDVIGTPLPSSLEAAVDALEGDAALTEALGKETVDTFAAIKRFEIERHAAHVSDWELDEYMQKL
jgi:glutamine synthetase